MSCKLYNLETVKMAGVLSFKDKTKLLFGAHGRFCASHPWEVIVTTVTLTVCVLSMSVLSGGKVATPCGVNKPCEKDVEEVRPRYV